MSDEKTVKITRPPTTHTVVLDDEDGTEVKIKMTYGLFQDLQRMMPDPGQAAEVLLDEPDRRDYILRRCFTPSKKIIVDFEADLIDAEEIELIDPEKINGVLEWVLGHLLHFFASSAGTLKRLNEQFREVMPNKAEVQTDPSKNGSKD